MRKTTRSAGYAVLCLLLLLSTWSGAAAASPRAAALTPPLQAAEPGLHVLAADATGITLELLTPSFETRAGNADGQTCHRLTVPGYAQSDLAGWPSLPVRGAMVGIPAQAAPTLTVLETEASALPPGAPICPVPTPIVESDPAGRVRYGGERSVRDPRAVATNALYPAAVAEIASTGFIRSQRVAQLRFYPFRTNPVTGQVEHIRRIRVRLSWTATGRSQESAIDEGPFEALLRAVLINYDAARPWRAAPSPASPRERQAASPTPAYRLLVNQDGLYQVSYADLQAAGVPVDSLDPRTFHLSNQGQEAAILVNGEADGSFDPGDYILFYGQGLDTRHTDRNVYWLTWGGTNGRRMAAVDGAPGGTATVPASFQTPHHAEENHVYTSGYPSGPDEDHWYWWYVRAASAPASGNFTTTLQHVAAAPPTATVRGLLRGYSAIPQHHSLIYLNGHLIDDATWAPRAEYAFTITVPTSYLLEGQNVISVSLPRDGGITYDFVYVNWFEMDYGKTYTAGDDRLFFDGDAAGRWEYQVDGFATSEIETFDISEPLSPTLIANTIVEPIGAAYRLRFEQTIAGERHYLAQSLARRLSPLSIAADSPSDLRSTANRADEIIIAPAAFITAALSLAGYRTAQGLPTVAVDVQDIYDEFNGGILDPEAIRGFLAYAYANWTRPAPTYVLLMGDGHYDFRDYTGYGEPVYMPPYLANVDPYMGETAADNRYVCVSGDDILPDMHIGRLPVRSSAEAAALVAKIIAYEQNPPPGNWNQQALFVADNADDAGDFAALSDIIINNYFPSPYIPERVYYGVTHLTPAAARAAIQGAINDGRLIVNYVGHASVQLWAQEQLLRLSDVPALTNTGRLPLMTPMTCVEGYFIYPSPAGADGSSLAETIVRPAQTGAIASWSPTGMGLTIGHDYLNRGLYQAIFFDDVIRVGAATTQGKLYLYANTGDYRDLLDTYVLLGDPALRLNLLPADVRITKTATPSGPLRPGDPLTYTLTYSNTGPATAHHVVITDALAAALVNPVVTSTGAPLTLRPGSRFVWDVADLPPGDGGVITIAATVSTTFSGDLVNLASIGSSAVETDTTNNIGGPTVTTVQSPDLVIGKSAPAQLPAGSAITYTLTYANVGDALAAGVVITDLLPVEVLSPTITFSGAAIVPRPDSRFVWDVADLPPGDGGVITITGVLSPTFVGVLSNTAAIVTALVEANLTNNIAGPVITGVDIPDLAIGKSAPAQLPAGSVITYTLTYTNVGLAPATQIVITDLLPVEVLSPTLTFSGAAIVPRPDSRFVWDVADLPPGDGGVITITGVLPRALGGTVVNTATIAAAERETSYENNSATRVTWLRHPLYLPLIRRGSQAACNCSAHPPAGSDVTEQRLRVTIEVRFGLQIAPQPAGG